jgi:WD40 repeat protein
MSTTNTIRVLLTLAVLAMLLAACAGRPTPVQVTIPPTDVPATSVPVASATASATPSPQPTMTPPSPTPSPTPLVPWGSGLQLISKSNVSSLKQVAQISGVFGTDGIQWAWQPDRRPLLALHQWPGANVTRQMEDWAIYDLGTLKPTIEITASHALVRNLNYGIAMSPNGQYVAVSGRFNSFKLYDTHGKLVRAFQGHTDRTRYVAFSPDNKWLASTSVDGTLRVWDMVTGQTMRVLSGEDKKGFAKVLFSPDSKLLAGVGDGVTYIWSVADGMLLNKRPGQGVAFSPDSKRIAWIGPDDVTIEILNVADWQVLFTAKGHVKSDLEGAAGVAGAAFSPDGRLFASAGYDDKTVQLWDAANGEVVSTLRRNAAVEAVAFSPDGKVLATFETAVDASGETITSPENGFHFFGVR